MKIVIVVIGVVVLLLIVFALAVRIIKQYERGVLFRLGRLRGVRAPGLRLIIPFVDILHRVSLRIVTMPIQSQGIITKDNVSVDVSAVAYFRVVDAVKSVVAIETPAARSTRSRRPRMNRAVARQADAKREKVARSSTLSQIPCPPPRSGMPPMS